MHYSLRLTKGTNGENFHNVQNVIIVIPYPKLLQGYFDGVADTGSYYGYGTEAIHLGLSGWKYIYPDVVVRWKYQN